MGFSLGKWLSRGTLENKPPAKKTEIYFTGIFPCFAAISSGYDLNGLATRVFRI